MLQIPEGIPKDLVDELEACQKQLKILFGNYKILKERQKNNPGDDVIPEQIKQVERYIIQFNEKQMPTIKKIRKLIKSQENGLNSSKSSEDDDISVKTDDEKPVSEEDILESLGLKHVARTPDGKIDHAKLSMKDRMAIVRGMRKRRKKGALMMEQEGKKSKNEIGIVDENEPNPDSLNVCGEGTIGEDQYNGFINTPSERFLAIPPTYDGSECNEIEKRRVETHLKQCSQLQFLANLNLFTPKEVDNVLDVVEQFSKKKIEYRNMTYIPEMLDKKLKISYNYLAPDINSPPLLRTRQRRPVTSNTTSRMTSRSNSRATTPERSITRQVSSVSSVSNDSNESNTAIGKKGDPSEKLALQKELIELKKRSDELQSILGANKRTISTRKERSRLSEFSDEANQLNTRIMQIKKILVKL